MVQYTAAQLDPFTAPAPTPIGSVRVRDHAIVQGVITDITVRRWVGGTPALHVTVSDATGSLAVAFLGHTRIAGIDAGACITVAGAVTVRGGRPLVMNPHVWLIGRAATVSELAAGRSLVHA